MLLPLYFEFLSSLLDLVPCGFVTLSIFRVFEGLMSGDLD
jgi:hypothetical protein